MQLLSEATVSAIDLHLIEWPDDQSQGPRHLGRIRDPDLVEEALRRLEQVRLRELSRIQGRTRLRPVASEQDED